MQMLLTFPHWPAGLPGLWRLPPSVHIPRVFWQASVRFLFLRPRMRRKQGAAVRPSPSSGSAIPPAFMFSTATLSLRSSFDNLPHIAFLPFRNGCRVEFFISFDKLLLPVFPGSRDLAFPFRGVVRVLRLVSGLEVLPVYFPDLAIQFLHRLSDLLCRGFLCHALRRFLSGVFRRFRMSGPLPPPCRRHFPV